VLQNAEKRTTGDMGSNPSRPAAGLGMRARSATSATRPSIRPNASKGLDASVLMEPDNMAFTDLATAYENILNGITSMDELTSDKEKNTKEKKKGNNQDPETRGL
jgi:hypothetical protein